MSKKTIAVLFGGQSSEHDISCLSVQNVLNHIDPERYDVLPIGITKEGRWLAADSVEQIADGTWRESPVSAILSPDAVQHGVLLCEDGRVRLQRVDVVFPVLHGMYGEDGTVQGLLELARIPYVGCGVLASAVAMDKVYTKLIVEDLSISQARHAVVHRSELSEEDPVIARIEALLPYPVFVKPSKAGSSKGVSKAGDREALRTALRVAAAEDSKILVEEAICGRELECGILGGAEVLASGIGEILPADEFYSFDAKYNNEDSRTVVSPELPEGKAEEIRRAAKDIFRAIGGAGIARVDFFLEDQTNRVIFNEINTLPGFTAISMYTMLWEEQGYSKAELVEALIESAFLGRD